MDTTITHIRGRRVWDSRGRPTVEAEVRLAGGASGRAIAPAGASRGSREAIDLRDGGESLGGLGVRLAVEHVNGRIAQNLRGVDATRQEQVDATLIALDGTANKATLGGNATIAVSMACLHAAAAAHGEPLWRYLAQGQPVRMPLPEIQIFGGGAQIGISLDIAASELGRGGRYRLALEERELDSLEMAELLMDWCHRYPIVSIEDPLAEDDMPGMNLFTLAMGDRLQIIGDDYLVTNAALVEQALRERACNAVLIKPNQAGTITETRAALQAGKAAGFGTIVSARSGETEDVTIVHLAIGWDAGQLNAGRAVLARNPR
jgi:enolase